MARETLVLGAGMVGVCIAHHLAERGRQVVLVDRRDPGRETSFGNAGLIQREAVEPHPFPRNLADLWRVIPNRSVDIRYRTGAMFSEVNPLFQYWRYSAPDAFARIVPEYASLIMHCTAEHARMVEAAGAQELIRKDGWLQAFRTSASFDRELSKAATMHDRFGVMHDVLDHAALRQLEPDLSATLIGAIHWTNTWSVIDPGALVQAYAKNFERLGGTIVQATARDIAQTDTGWQLETSAGSLSAQELVLATGPWSTQWLAKLSYRLPMFVMRGYHMHYGAQPGATLNHGLMDFERGYLLTPKRAGLRLTTGAELNTIDAPPLTGQLDAAEAEAKSIFPLGQRRDRQPWKGARPCMADMKPVIGPGYKHRDLWFAFGHGHQGFTLGPITGRLVGEMMSGETPAVDMTPFRADRF